MIGNPCNEGYRLCSFRFRSFFIMNKIIYINNNYHYIIYMYYICKSKIICMLYVVYFFDGIFHSKCIWLSGCNPLVALKIFSMHALCWNNELITGVSLGVLGAFNKKLNTEIIVFIFLNSVIVSSLSSCEQFHQYNKIKHKWSSK